MKAVLKTVKPELCLNYDETFNGYVNLAIRHELIPELRKSLAPKFHPSVQQLTMWLSSLHKSRRSQAKMKNSGKISNDYRRIHANNRSNDVCNIIQIFYLLY